MYLKINGSNKKYQASVVPFKTQHGNQGVKIIGDVPETNKGFKLYDDKDQVISDYSSFVYLYKENAYTEAEEQIEEGSCSFDPLPSYSSYDDLNRKINNLNNRVKEITPYKQEKVGYYGDKEKTFYDVPEGNVSVFFDNYDGNYSVKRLENGLEGLVVSFPESLKKQTTITIMVQ
jgi:hypothetical protein